MIKLINILSEIRVIGKFDGDEVYELYDKLRKDNSGVLGLKNPISWNFHDLIIKSPYYKQYMDGLADEHSSGNFKDFITIFLGEFNKEGLPDLYSRIIKFKKDNNLK